jgi:HAD superfamily hydrolase (TIGR01509 family)
MTRFIDQFQVILLDMMGTFMFSGDRFSQHEDYFGTYRNIGGGLLSADQVNSAITEVFRRMSTDYENPALDECFPAVRHYLAQVLSEKNLPGGETELLDAVFALHETGVIPPGYVEIIRRLSHTHRLGVVSNIWCGSRSILEEFDRAGVRGMFEVAVFSSEYGVNKPSPLLYGRALERLGVGASKAVFVGDNLRRDVAGARAAGLAAVWIDQGGRGVEGGTARPDKTIGYLSELLTV